MQTPGIRIDGNDPVNTFQPAELDALNPETFQAPVGEYPIIKIEYCDRCRWQPRAQWLTTELLLTFPPPTVQSVSLVPRNLESTAGRFRVWLFDSDNNPPKLLWDRKIKGGFPEAKELKQIVRDSIAPGMSLGHSDKK
ncbi:hypothetical protein E3Q22_00447 [Wallemia mellicola]|uniref:Uncharacterized protein n=2 Tax=Wallemia mellicola TaxID=1708541 RepID=A0A4V4MK04_9BASI|nr:hypothetical protein WALSEDRAFT_60614 [Wallemia mellicola CBS 633.66]TIB73225.1 hypothetical protein E3Q24_01250 [Wallemia mellicola]EIM21173.1 hypothetical protein WALSEDRAFT_60614 [Wallemia mellicola CBS 633.66]TIB76743.1 hypothetical protein E3Q23_01674 [Wallemia mellicola]TIB82173.1 hypothetical protein E3Q22_00447 [Wallemia mellicola]TIB87705.1 hypothetical protein E3Q21_01209 [Wallemia mellicola]|eukprot:XP_006958846.1 hypothetical protein WALSEDRAFT_60614 [Wallemia mellicola CBS 633.66]